MDDGEFMVMFFSGGTGLAFWGIWLYNTLSPSTLYQSTLQRWALALAPLVSAILLFGILRMWAAEDVRYAPKYLLMYQSLGTGWLGIIAVVAFPWMGLHYVQDAIERRNPAAAVAICGALLGFTLAFAGGNIGEGPGWWVVIFSSGLATLTLFAAWSALSQYANMAEEISVDRDMAAGLRLGGFLLAAGMVAGRAAAGNWVSAGATIVDFVQIAWVIVPLLGITWAFDYYGSPTPERPAPPVTQFGWLPALLCVGLAIGWLVAVGGW